MMQRMCRMFRDRVPANRTEAKTKTTCDLEQSSPSRKHSEIKVTKLNVRAKDETVIHTVARTFASMYCTK